MSVVNIKANHGTVGRNCKYSHVKYWLEDKNNEYVGRGMRIGISEKDSGDGSRTFIIPQSPYHNPYVIGKDGTREEVLIKFERYFLSSGLVERARKELPGKVLGCWCHCACHPEPCHALIILKYLQ